MKKWIVVIGLSSVMLLANNEGLANLLVGTLIKGIVDGVQFAPGVNESEVSPKAKRLKKVCESDSVDNIKSCDELVEMFKRGDGVPRNININAMSKFEDIATKHVIKNCNNGDVSQCHDAAIRAEKSQKLGSGIIGNTFDSLSLREKACSGGYTSDCITIAREYEDKSKYNKAIEYYKMACDGNDRYSCEKACNLGEDLQSCQHFANIKNSNQSQAPGSTIESAQMGMIKMYGSAMGTNITDEKAKEILKDAEKQEMQKRNLAQKTLRLYKQACDRGDASSCERLLILQSRQ